MSFLINETLDDYNDIVSLKRNLSIMAFIITLFLASMLIFLGMNFLALLLLLTSSLVVWQRYLLAWRSLMILIIVSVLFIPSNLYKLPSFLPFDVEVYRVSAFLFLLMWMIALLVDKDVKIRRTPLDFLLLLISLSVLISFLVNVHNYDPVVEFRSAIKAVLYILTFPLLYIAIVSIFTDKKTIHFFFKTIATLGLILAVFAIVERMTGYSVFQHLNDFIPILKPSDDVDFLTTRNGRLRVRGSAGHPIAFSTLLAMILPISISYMLSVKTTAKQILYALFAGITIIAIILTGSRTGVIGSFVVFCFFFATYPNYRKRLLAFLAAVITLVHISFTGALGTLIAWLSPSYIAETEIGNQAGRFEDYPRVWHEFVKHPLFGLGFGSTDPHISFFLDNQYLVFSLLVGLMGLVVFIVLFLAAIKWTLRKGIRSEKQEDKILIAVAASLSVFTVSTATFDSFGFPQVPYLYFILLALGVAYALNNEEMTAKGCDSKELESGYP